MPHQQAKMHKISAENFINQIDQYQLDQEKQTKFYSILLILFV